MGIDVKGNFIVYGNYNHIDHVDNIFNQQSVTNDASALSAEEAVTAEEAVATEVAVVDGGLADYVRIPARQEEILSALHANIDGKKGRAVALVITCAIEEGLLNRPPFPVLEKEFGDIGSRQNYSKAINQGFSEVEKRRYQKLFAALKS